MATHTDYEKMLYLFRPQTAKSPKEKAVFEAVLRASMAFAIVIEKELPKTALKTRILEDFLGVQQRAFHAISHSEHL